MPRFFISTSLPGFSVARWWRGINRQEAHPIKGASGRRGRQGGAFAAPAPGVTDTLSRVQIWVQEGDRVEATLTVHRGERLLGEARLDTTLEH